MIYGIGVDMVKIERIEDGIVRFGDRLARKILNETEYSHYDAQSRPARFLAKRFAAKEAVVKALGTGFIRNISPREISIINDDLGKPNLFHSDKTRALFERNKITSCHISITDEEDYALAYVLLESS